MTSRLLDDRLEVRSAPDQRRKGNREACRDPCGSSVQRGRLLQDACGDAARAVRDIDPHADGMDTSRLAARRRINHLRHARLDND